MGKASNLLVYQICLNCTSNVEKNLATEPHDFQNHPENLSTHFFGMCHNRSASQDVIFFQKLPQITVKPFSN